MKDKATKKYDDNGIDEIGQTGLEDKAAGHGIDKCAPVECNEQTGSAYIGPLLSLMAKTCQTGQQVFLHNQDKTENGRPDDTRCQRIQRGQVAQQNPECRQDAPDDLTEHEVYVVHVDAFYHGIRLFFSDMRHCITDTYTYAEGRA